MAGIQTCPLLFEGLEKSALDDIYAQMQPRQFARQEVICRRGDPGDSLFILQRGLAEVLLELPEGTRSVARLRRGEIVGELSLVTGEPRSATVVATLPTDVLEMSRDAFAALLGRHPALLMNLNRILSQRLVLRNLRPVESRRRGELVALVMGPQVQRLASPILAATRSASPQGVAAIDLTGALEGREVVALEEPDVGGILTILDDLLAAHGLVIAVVDLDREDLPLLLEHMDRVLTVVAEAETDQLATRLHPAADRAEVALQTAGPRRAAGTVSGLRMVRALDLNDPRRDVAWLGRHLSRTKIGLALGAGGAKGYAHVGALHCLEEAGYVIDYVAGSSIGAMVGAWLALGQKAAEIEETMHQVFNPENVAAMFKLSMSGLSTGLEVHTQLCRESTGDRSFEDLLIPLVAMTVDLNTRQPAPIREGPLWQALLASTALAGLFPPFVRGSQRLVDGLALVPVPTGSVIEDGADLTISVNIMSREILPAWPGEAPPPPPTAKAGVRMLDTLLEVIDLAQLDSSIRHAALADVVMTPRFGPASWREFHRADQFLAAGRAAAEEQLASLHNLARPQVGDRFA